MYIRGKNGYKDGLDVTFYEANSCKRVDVCVCMYVCVFFVINQ